MRPVPTNIHLFSTTTPIQPGVLTMVDLGDTSGAFTPLMPVQPVDEDNHHILPAINSQDVVDLRSLGFKKGELIPYSGNVNVRVFDGRTPGDEVDEQQTQRKVSSRIARACVTLMASYYLLLCREVLDHRIRLTDP